MIINHTQENPAILSNVGEIGEFRIRNSAKAFNILSSGLYANKIRAIIRELSCNAVDSHVAAGKEDVPFEVHLPVGLEPWFAVRDFGTGLNHDQVTNIYTTYFESTKTNSNEFIGALGLGSKSPFSYTDNFTVTAIKDGVKRIYSAFINEAGVPSVALMNTTETDEANGVEVKFSVADRYDFGKFADEARSVYSYFKLRPKIIGTDSFAFKEFAYKDRDIAPGIHRRDNTGWHSTSMAVMGNIAYPIDVPNAEKNLEHLASMLECGLEIHFDIGELDFQASREGLSYIPQTINSIKHKLEQLQARLAIHIAEKANAIDNLWERALYLNANVNDKLYGAAVRKYAADTKFELVDDSKTAYSFLKEIVLTDEELANDFNMQIKGFSVRAYGYYDSKTSLLKKASKQVTVNGNLAQLLDGWAFRPAPHTIFVENTLKTGALTRARYHYGKNQESYQQYVYLMEAFDKSKPVLFKEFLAKIHNPPTVVSVDTLSRKERISAEVRKNILRMDYDSTRYHSKERARWVETSGEFDDDTTYFYLPLNNVTSVSEIPATELISSIRTCGIKDLAKIELYGVRKSNMKDIKDNDNWVNAEDWIRARIAAITEKELDDLAMAMVDSHRVFKYNTHVLAKVDNASPFKAYANKLAAVKIDGDTNLHSLNQLCRVYGKEVKFEARAENFKKEGDDVINMYPLLKELGYVNNVNAVAQYINLIDNANKQGA